MNPYQAAGRKVIANWLLWAVETVLLFAGVAAVYGWLSIPVATAWHLAVHVLAAVGILILLIGAVLLAEKKLGRVRWQSGRFVLMLLVGTAVAGGLGFGLMTWIPDLQSLTAQMVSAGVRFLLAGLLLTGTMLWVWAFSVEE